jgi:hypothetical protein
MGNKRACACVLLRRTKPPTHANTHGTHARARVCAECVCARLPVLDAARDHFERKRQPCRAIFSEPHLALAASAHALQQLVRAAQPEVRHQRVHAAAAEAGAHGAARFQSEVAPLPLAAAKIAVLRRARRGGGRSGAGARGRRAQHGVCGVTGRTRLGRDAACCGGGCAHVVGQPKKLDVR